jgi:aryl-alcohol dehydrogenase-like predicted oxidoreductase
MEREPGDQAFAQGRFHPQGVRSEPAPAQGGRDRSVPDSLAAARRDIEEGWGELARLKQEGNARWIGVSNFNIHQMERIARVAPITSLQPPYSAIFPGIETEILPYCQQRNIGVIVYRR